MYLKRLQIHGFKTFASKTDFVFNPGITAIVGPNGCGKSNIADALRWVLGEQSFSALRSKKTEDVIFAGSNVRSPLGMAEVAITLDNSAGLLPVDFNEVTIARRAYRSGENEYFVNKSRVRLKDVDDVVACAAQEYTVVNQGLADAALLLKPDQRRGLFEEAADISRLNAKRKEAEVKLAATEQNILRVSDIAAELQPRLKSLRRQARQADAYQQLGDELRGLQREWYRRRCDRLQTALDSAKAAEETVAAAREAGVAELTELRSRLDEIRRRRGDGQREISLWLAERRNAEARSEDLVKQVAVLQERAAALERQKVELAEEVTSLRSTAHAEKDQLNLAEDRLAKDREESNRLAEQVRELEKRLAARDLHQSEAQERLSQAQERSFSVASRLADLRNRLAQLKERHLELAEQARINQETAKERRDLVEQRKTEAASILKAIADLDTQAQQQADEYRQLEAEMAASLERQKQLERTREDLRRKEGEARTRLDTLSRLRDTQTGYYTGVKTVLQAAGKKGDGKGLGGIVGLVANLVEVPAEFEVAMEVALGGHLQDIVVERWADAEAAISLLKKTNGGRATFLPLDVVRVSNAPRIRPRDGVFGLGLDLVHFEERLRGVFGHLLGRTVVVRDLKVARELLAGEEQRFTIVTISGEIVHPGGAVTGGSATKQAGVLSRERELRELPAELERFGREVRHQDDLLRQERSQLDLLREKAADLKLAERHSQSLRTMHKDALLRSQREMEQALKQVNWYEPLERKLRKEMEALVEKEVGLKQELEKTEAENVQTQGILQSLREETAAASRERALENERLSDLRASASAVDQVYQKQTAVVQTHRLNLQRAGEEMDRRLRKLDDLSSQGDASGRELGQLEGEAEAASLSIGELSNLIIPAEENLRQWQAEENALEDTISRQNSRLLELEAERGQAAVELERSRGELTNLRARAREDLGEAAEDLGVASVGPGTDLSEEELQERVEQLTTRIQRLGPINLAALTDYEQEASRLDYLETELNDLTQASKSLRQVIRELDRLMHERFEETFAAVAQEFGGYFVRLFGGGSAKLTLTSPDDLQHSGIDILAQPPGKRPQNLAALSGGERALTSTALLFAILKVNPSPFSLLDEVDAALDEANVGRFRSCLEELSDRTQFIVITHNQGTVQTADSVYGVSMGPDGTSKVVSLELGRYAEGNRESA